MRVPKYTDLHRYPHGYVPAQRTNLRATFARVRAALKDAEQRTALKVAPIKRKQG